MKIRDLAIQKENLKNGILLSVDRVVRMWLSLPSTVKKASATCHLQGQFTTSAKARMGNRINKLQNIYLTILWFHGMLIV